MSTLKTDNIEYDCALNAAHKIVEVALRHGFDKNLKDEFNDYVEDCIRERSEYAQWEEDMGDDL